MKVKIITFLGVILAFNLMIASLVFSDSVFIVMGTVKNPDGSLVNTGLQVTVTNETRNLTVETVVDNKESGGFNAVFMDFENKSVAEDGDTIKVIVKDNQASIATQTYKLTVDDIAKTRAIISLTTSISEECFKGDINGDNAVKSNDAIFALRISSDLLSPTPQQLCAGDMNGDGKIKSNDAILILRKVVGSGAPSKKFAKSDKVNIILDKVYGKAGQNITIPLNIDNGDLVSGGDFTIVYDQSSLRVTDISSNDSVLLESNLTEPGKLKISFACISKLGSNIANLHFTVLADRLPPLLLQSAELYRSDALPIIVNTANNRLRSEITKPDNNLLFQNYPNPFNPETWIPYQLNKGVDVVVKIYSLSGLLIRTLNLGYKSAGIYTSQDKAIYWDGKNEAGERIASGIYFYTIQAEDFVATKRMVIAK